LGSMGPAQISCVVRKFLAMSPTCSNGLLAVCAALRHDSSYRAVMPPGEGCGGGREDSSFQASRTIRTGASLAFCKRPLQEVVEVNRDRRRSGARLETALDSEVRDGKGSRLVAFRSSQFGRGRPWLAVINHGAMGRCDRRVLRAGWMQAAGGDLHPQRVEE
jgi:hypothetical protein